MREDRFGVGVKFHDGGDVEIYDTGKTIASSVWPKRKARIKH